jgi:FKBP-type peptidyl-prolyl cis-trans isomerase SlyD
MIKGFDDAVVGMRQGDAKTVTLQPQDAYGEWDPAQVVSFPRSQINATDLKVGSALYAASGAIGIVTEISGQNVTVDFNHPLAGKTLVFTIDMLRVDKKMS